MQLLQELFLLLSWLIFSLTDWKGKVSDSVFEWKLAIARAAQRWR
jgi:hypothetical protein